MKQAARNGELLTWRTSRFQAFASIWTSQSLAGHNSPCATGMENSSEPYGTADPENSEIYWVCSWKRDLAGRAVISALTISWTPASCWNIPSCGIEQFRTK